MLVAQYVFRVFSGPSMFCLCLFKVTFYFLPWASSPLFTIIWGFFLIFSNHHLKQASKSKVCKRDLHSFSWSKKSDIKKPWQDKDAKLKQTFEKVSKAGRHRPIYPKKRAEWFDWLTAETPKMNYKMGAGWKRVRTSHSSLGCHVLNCR